MLCKTSDSTLGIITLVGADFPHVSSKEIKRNLLYQPPLILPVFPTDQSWPLHHFTDTVMSSRDIITFSVYSHALPYVLQNQMLLFFPFGFASIVEI